MNYADGDALKYDTAQKYLVGSSPGWRHHLMDYPDAPGVQGTGTKDFAARAQALALELVYVNTSEANLKAAWEADQVTLGNGPVDVVIAGVTYQACTIVADGSKMLQPRSCGNGYYRASASLALVRRRFS